MAAFHDSLADCVERDKMGGIIKKCCGGVADFFVLPFTENDLDSIADRLLVFPFGVTGKGGTHLEEIYVCNADEPDTFGLVGKAIRRYPDFRALQEAADLLQEIKCKSQDDTSTGP